MADNQLLPGVSLEQTDAHIHIEFSKPRKVLSSAVLNGGISHAMHLLNIYVDEKCSHHDVPEIHLSNYCIEHNWVGITVGMMTAAPMDSLRIARSCIQDVDIIVLVTAGLSNPRRAGDHAEYRTMAASPDEIGTINIVVLTSADLTETAMVEAMMITTEAKAVALQDAGVISPVSKEIATGTGTDSHAIVNGYGPPTVAYCGKHVLFGEILGRLVVEAVTASINAD